MSVMDLARVIIYRVHEKGLEIFLTSEEHTSGQANWQLPSYDMLKESGVNLIELNPLQDVNGNYVKTLAIEGDWHDIPSIRGLIRQDVKIVKEKIKEVFPSIEKGAYFSVKEAFKKVLPHEYQAIKELKEIIIDRNSVIYI